MSGTGPLVNTSVYIFFLASCKGEAQVVLKPLLGAGCGAGFVMMGAKRLFSRP